MVISMKRRLSELEVGQEGKIVKIDGPSSLKKKLLDMGLTPNTRIRVVRVAPLSDPVDFEVRGYQLSLRRNEAINVIVEVVNE